MKRILSALALAATVLSAFAAIPVAKEKLTAQKGPIRKTKFICAQSGAGVTFISEYATREECAKGCRGAAVSCEETGMDTPINTTPDEDGE